MDQLVNQFFNIEVMRKSLPLLVSGFGMTVLLCCAVIPLGFLGGLASALASISTSAWIRRSTMVFIDIFRALPPLVLLILIYSGLPFAGIHISPFAAVVLAFFLNNSAYYGEVIRAGLLSVDKGQAEAARSTGLTKWQSLIHVVLPQALRNVLPDLISNSVEVVKMTSLASTVSLAEMLYAADMARSVTYNASPITLAAIVYLVLLWPVVRVMSRFQRKIAN